MKILNWFFGVLLTLTLLVLLAVLILPRVIDPNDYRDQITELVQQHTGRELQLKGDLEVSVFPWLGVNANQLSLSQPSAIGGDFITMESAQLRVRALPLLQNRLEVDTIVLQSPRINLITLENGASSLDGLADSNIGQTNAGASAETLSAGEVAVALIIQGIEISDGELLIEDRLSNSKTQIRELNLSTGDLLGDEIAPLAMSGVLLDANSLPLSFMAEGLARIDQSSASLLAENLELELDQGGTSVSGEILQLNIEGANLVLAKNVKLEVSGAQVMPSAMPSTILTTAPEVRLDIAKELLFIPTATGTLENLNANLNQLSVSGFEQPKISADVLVEEFDLKPLLKQFDLDYEPEKIDALSRVSYKSRVNGGLDSAELSGLVLKLDDAKLTGRASLKNFLDPALTFDLQASAINLDDYLPKEIQNSATQEPELSSAESLAVPMAVFQQLNANGELSVQQLTTGGVSMQDILVKVQSQGNQFSVIPKAKLYDGQLDGRLDFTDSATPELRIKQDMDLVDLGRFLADADLSEQLRGLGSLAVDIRVREENGVQRNSGVIKINADNGEISGFDMHALLEQANSIVSLLSSKGDQAQQSDAQVDAKQNQSSITRFAKLNGTFNLNDFVLSNGDLEILAPAFKLSGEGEIDIANQTIDYLARLSVDENIDGLLGEKLNKIKGQVIPIRCQGSLTAPRCLPDTKELYRLYLDSRVTEKQGNYLKREFGIEGGESLSTKDALKQILINKALKKDKQVDNNNEDGPSAQENGGQDPANAADQNQEPEQEGESLEDQLKRKLLESLLN